MATLNNNGPTSPVKRMKPASNNERFDVLAAFFAAFDDAAMFIEPFDLADAYEFAQEFTDKTINTLRRDPRWAAIRHAELDLMFADLRKRFAQDMFAALGGFASFRELRRAAGEAFTESQQS